MSECERERDVEWMGGGEREREERGRKETDRKIGAERI